MLYSPFLTLQTLEKHVTSVDISWHVISCYFSWGTMTTTDFGEVLSEWMALFLDSSKIRWQRCSFLLNRAKSFCRRSQDGRANSQTPKSLLLVAQILIFVGVRYPLFVAWLFCLGHFGWISMTFYFLMGENPAIFDYRLVELIDVHFSCLL